MTTILSKERVDELRKIAIKYPQDKIMMDVFNALFELSELRSIVANIDDRDTEYYEQCPFCLSSCLETEIRIRHSPDCPVLRYTSYRKEV